jgi:transcriptional regulator with XRE-family HTH domain
MSQTTLADAVGVSFQQLQKYENGPNRGASRLQHISHVLQVPTEFLFDGAPHTGANHPRASRKRKRQWRRFHILFGLQCPKTAPSWRRSMR